MKIDAAITDFLLARDRAPRTDEWYKDKLDRFASWCATEELTDTDQLDPATLRRFLAHLKAQPGHLHRGQMTSQTIHGYARTLRAFCYHGRDEGWYNSEWCVWWRKGMPRRERKLIRTFTPDQIHLMLLACDARRPATRERDRAILLLLLDTGMRASELCGLTLDRLGSDSAIVYGKGRKERTVGPIGRQCQRQLLRYIERFRVGRAGVETVFTTDEGDPMTLSSLDGLLKWIRDEAGITGVRVSAHTFRHTFAVSYLQQPGADIYKLKLLLGHSNVTTTELYLADFEQRQARQGSSVADTIYAHSGLTGTSQRGILRRGQAVHHGDN